MTVNPFLYTKMPFDAEKDLVPVASVARVLVFLVTHPSVPANNVAEFIAYAKANPGKLSYGSAGTGSSPHLAGEMFKRAGAGRGDARSVQGRRAGADRPARRPGAVHVRSGAGAAPREGRQAEAARGRQPEAGVAVSRHADVRRSSACRRRRGHDVRHLRAGAARRGDRDRGCTTRSTRRSRRRRSPSVVNRLGGEVSRLTLPGVHRTPEEGPRALRRVHPGSRHQGGVMSRRSDR